MHLEKKAGFKHENIRLLTDEKASMEDVRVGFSDFAAKATSKDLLVVYVATHGFHDPRPGRSDRMYLAWRGKAPSIDAMMKYRGLTATQ